MSSNARKLFDEALRLPAQERASLAAKLIESLDDTHDEDSEALWAVEIARRLKEIDEGRVRPVPWSEVRASLLKR